MSLNIELARHNMIEQQVRPWDVLDSRVLEALSAIRREDFVPPSLRNLAFTDFDLPIGHGEVMLRPVLEGRLLQAAAPNKSESVLEVGTGSGFFTACLARLAAEVVSIEQHVDLVQAANTRLHAANVRNARIENADALRGFEPRREFDVMVVTGAVFEFPQDWSKWVKNGGRIVAIVGASPVQNAVLYTRNGTALEAQSLFETDLPYLHGAEPPQRFSF